MEALGFKTPVPKVNSQAFIEQLLGRQVAEVSVRCCWLVSRPEHKVWGNSSSCPRNFCLPSSSLRTNAEHFGTPQQAAHRELTASMSTRMGVRRKSMTVSAKSRIGSDSRPHYENKKKNLKESEEVEENGVGEDPLEELFAQLEMDLEAGGISDDEDFTEEEVVELEKELEAALMDFEEEEESIATNVLQEGSESRTDADDLDEDSSSLLGRKSLTPRQVRSGEKKSGAQKSRAKVEEEYTDVKLEEYEDDEDEQRVVALETWQLRKLAAAVETGRRKVNIKALSAEIGLDRFDVLCWLKDPPPELLMLTTTMEDDEHTEDHSTKDAKSRSSPVNSSPAGKQVIERNPDDGRNWHSQKRLKKEHEATFERVFRSTDRPSNAIIQNLVELTHMPRKRIVEWFDRRRKGGKASPKFEALR